MKEKQTKKPIVSVICAMLVTVLFASTLTGCGFFLNTSGGTATSLSFSQSSMTLTVGERYTITNLLTYKPSTASDVSVVLTSSDTGIVGVSDYDVMAVSEGTAVITATLIGNSRIYDTITVNTSYSEIEYGVEAQGELLQIQDNTSAVTFSVKTNSNSNPEYITNTEWLVNDVVESVGGEFVFTPNGVGTDTVYARSTVGKDTKTSEVFKVIVYAAGASAHYELESGSLKQEDEAQTVVFRANVVNEGNQASTIIWMVNGAVLQSSTSRVFSFTPPRSGEYVITAYLNSVNNKILFNDSQESVTVVLSADIELENVRVNFDNMYPHVYLEWDDPDLNVDFEVRITNQSGNVFTYQSNNAEHASFFDGCSFDLSLPTVTGAKVFKLVGSTNLRETYTLGVRSLGDGSGKLTSDFITVNQRQIESRAEAYWSDVLIENKMDRYLTSDEEANELTRFMIESFREQSTEAATRNSFRAYVGYTNSICAQSNKIFDNYYTYYAKLSYNISNTSTSVASNVFTANFTTSYANIPTRSPVGDVNYYNNIKIARRAFMRPDINYPGTEDGRVDRDKDYDDFAINSIEATMPVSTSTQLYYAVENEVRPIPEKGSRAEIIYNNAKEVVRQIISDDMTDAQKAIAFYEWCGWRNIYDFQVGDAGGNTFMNYASSYLDSIFYTEDAYSDGFRPYTICAGYTAAYQLLCAIEGLPCNAVMGDGHIWNEVYISQDPAYVDGWYLVDITFGVTAIVADISVFYDDNIHEMVQDHSYVLASDKYMTVSHATSSYDYVKTASSEDSYYKNTYIDENGEYDKYLTEAELSALNMQNQVKAFVNHIMSEDNREEILKVPAGDGTIEDCYRRLAYYDYRVEASKGSGTAHFNTYKSKCETFVEAIRSEVALELGISVSKATEIVRFIMSDTSSSDDRNLGSPVHYVLNIMVDLPALNAHI